MMQTIRDANSPYVPRACVPTEKITVVMRTPMRKDIIFMKIVGCPSFLMIRISIVWFSLSEILYCILEYLISSSCCWDFFTFSF